MAGGLGRRVPTDFEHVQRFALMAAPESALVTCEKTLRLPHWWYRGQHDQGEEGACVGFGTTLMMAIINMYEEGKTPRYDPWWLWDRSKERDEWTDTNPGDTNGTSVRAACDVLRTLGHVRTTEWIEERRSAVPATAAHLREGIRENRWARTVDEMRAVMALGLPMSIGVNWYSNFDTPKNKVVGDGRFHRRDWVIGEGDLGPLRGGHCVCVYGGSDRRQAFKIANSWGRTYPPVWMPYETMQRLIREDGEVALVTDLPTAA